jgi:hypothetical protein
VKPSGQPAAYMSPQEQFGIPVLPTFAALMQQRACAASTLHSAITIAKPSSGPTQ